MSTTPSRTPGAGTGKISEPPAPPERTARIARKQPIPDSPPGPLTKRPGSKRTVPRPLAKFSEPERTTRGRSNPRSGQRLSTCSRLSKDGSGTGNHATGDCESRPQSGICRSRRQIRFRPAGVACRPDSVRHTGTSPVALRAFCHSIAARLCFPELCGGAINHFYFLGLFQCIYHFLRNIKSSKRYIAKHKMVPSKYPNMPFAHSGNVIPTIFNGAYIKRIAVM